MKTVLIEENSEGKKAYNSVVVNPRGLGILTNELTLKIIQRLSEKPGCALDIARSLEVHEQKIYYHLRKLEATGVIRLLRSEKRLGMTAKIYTTVSPVVSAKLYDDGFSLKSEFQSDPLLIKFLDPFVTRGRMNSIMIVGDSYSHGRYDAYSTEGPHLLDFSMLLGNIVTEKLEFPHYKLDTEVTEEDLKNNLIIFGNPKTNTIIDKINKNLPITFDMEKGSIKSKESGMRYTDPRNGVIIKMENPFNPEKMILVIGGNRTRGTQSSVIALTQDYKNILKEGTLHNFYKILVGMDKSGNKIIDSIKVLE